MFTDNFSYYHLISYLYTLLCCLCAIILNLWRLSKTVTRKWFVATRNVCVWLIDAAMDVIITTSGEKQSILYCSICGYVYLMSYYLRFATRIYSAFFSIRSRTHLQLLYSLFEEWKSKNNIFHIVLFVLFNSCATFFILFDDAVINIWPIIFSYFTISTANP